MLKMSLRYGTESDKYTLQVITHTHTRIVSTLKKKRYRAGVGASAERSCLSKFHTRLRRSGVEKETVLKPKQRGPSQIMVACCSGELGLYSIDLTIRNE